MGMSEEPTLDLTKLECQPDEVGDWGVGVAVDSNLAARGSSGTFGQHLSMLVVGRGPHGTLPGESVA